jgi:phosphatidylethanolamine/phosphatidyl-N-methylethanolamine N-methyltransferase
MSRWLFFRRLLDGKHVGSVTPSSRRAADRLARVIDPSRPQRVVELGPGTGAVTHAILRRMHSRSTLVCIERDTAFAAHLRSTVRDARVRILRADANRLGRLVPDPVDVVVSSIPLAVVPAASAGRLIRAAADRLRTGGTFTCYQYAPVWLWPRTVHLVEASIGTPHSGRVWWNLPPMVVITARKTG